MKPGSAGRIVLHAALLAGAFLALLPMLWMVSASLMPAGQATAYPPQFLPSPATFEHYRTVFSGLNMRRYLLNSAVIALTVTVVSLFVNSMAGYAFAKLRFPGRERIFGLLG
ncbi:MAG TPA: hypothetical protein VK012_00825, partial [Gemmatimonadales bacterium]|nr:hypothetical protein [Gemmatimonadales bacterium]